jgi:hypothetical protein
MAAQEMMFFLLEKPGISSLPFLEKTAWKGTVSQYMRA